ncbi:hypothetical protein IW492_14305 [Enterococcus sp. BWB1-3]|uniref:hypothetical protein n=1 Tax=Enterococcus sp. BWB1-3 TaxID=2787713 RepID=UPI0019222D26|nr:hypothetical protein [Enterococcus sp. BWB1-3]MBL1230403.1 hypothetical protein [Enterococcus sp. BWB1-3]
MNFFKKLFGREEEVSLKPSTGQQKAVDKKIPAVKREIEAAALHNFAENFPNLPKIEMTKLVQALKNIIDQKAMQKEQNKVLGEDYLNKPDFSSITSMDKALEEARAGNLESLYLIDERFGGSTGIENTVFVPVGIAKIKDSFDTLLEGLLRNGTKISFNCQPEYKGRSFIPAVIVIKATDTETGKLIVDEKIIIW